MNYHHKALRLHSNKQNNNNQIKCCTACRRTLIRATPCCRLPRLKHQIMLLKFNYGIVFIELVSFFFLLSYQSIQSKTKTFPFNLHSTANLLVLKVLGFTCHKGLRLKHSRGYPNPRAVTSQTRRAPEQVVAPRPETELLVYWPSC